jgi:hypothetical protein
MSENVCFLNGMQEVSGSIPLCSTTLPFKNSVVGLLPGGAVLGFCPDFDIEPFNTLVFPA